MHRVMSLFDGFNCCMSVIGLYIFWRKRCRVSKILTFLSDFSRILRLLQDTFCCNTHAATFFMPWLTQIWLDLG